MKWIIIELLSFLLFNTQFLPCWVCIFHLNYTGTTMSVHGTLTSSSISSSTLEISHFATMSRNAPWEILGEMKTQKMNDESTLFNSFPGSHNIQ